MCNKTAILDGACDRRQSGCIHKVGGVSGLVWQVEILALLKAVCDDVEGSLCMSETTKLSVALF